MTSQTPPQPSVPTIHLFEPDAAPLVAELARDLAVPHRVLVLTNVVGLASAISRFLPGSSVERRPPGTAVPPGVDLLVLGPDSVDRELERQLTGRRSSLLDPLHERALALRDRVWRAPYWSAAHSAISSSTVGGGSVQPSLGRQ